MDILKNFEQVLGKTDSKRKSLKTFEGTIQT